MNDSPRAPAAAAGAFDAAEWREQLLALNPWARGLTIDEKDRAFAKIRQEATLERHAQGKDAWNAWASEMLALKVGLNGAGLWAASGSRKLTVSTRVRGENYETRNWLTLATAPFAMVQRNITTAHKFDNDTSFESFVFPGDAEFNHATFTGHANFEHATFHGDAWFGGAAFSRRAMFGGATFSAYAWFRRAKFSDVAGFDEATFSGESRFRRATFGANSYVKNARFMESADFSQATFCGGATLESSVFAEGAN